MAAITAAAIGAATTLGSAYMAKKNAAKQQKLAQEGISAADPLAKYRPEYAAQLDKLMKDPSSIADTPEYKARQLAASRQMSAQGYTGSGNAIIEAAEAGGQSYSEAVARLSGLAGGQMGGGYSDALNAQQAGQDQRLSSYEGVAAGLGNLASTIGSKGGFNQGISAPQMQTFKPSTSVSVPNPQYTPPPVAPLKI